MTQDDASDQLPTEDVGFRCPSCGYNLTAARNWTCPECGRRVTLDELVPPGSPLPPLVVMGQPVMLSKAIGEILQRYRIPYELIASTAEKLWGSGPFANGVAVPLEYYIEAATLIALYRRGAPLPAPPALAGPQVDWKCPSCGEENPASFEICWNCKGEAPTRGAAH